MYAMGSTQGLQIPAEGTGPAVSVVACRAICNTNSQSSPEGHEMSNVQVNVYRMACKPARLGQQPV